MSFVTKRKNSAKNVLALVLVGAMSLSLWGCFGDGGPNSYTEPNLTKTANVLINAATLQGWINQGLVNNRNGNENVVIIDVTSAANYAAGHIPGAVFWDSSDQLMTRVEGPAEAVNMVLDGASMDAKVQKAGIDGRSTIVITSSSGNTSVPSRTYFLFRYWGWDKSKLKVLNGYNGAMAASSVTPTEVTPSDFSVADNGSLNADERASLSEMIEALSDAKGVPLDTRGATGAAGTTPGVFDEDGSGSPTDDGEFVVFDGLMPGSVPYSQANFYNAGDLTFLDAATIEANLAPLGVDGSEVIYSYCRTGWLASTGYFVFDAILGWEVMLYDGSWSQWGQMSANAAKGGVLPAGSPWVTDTAALTPTVNYNSDAGNTIEVLTLSGSGAANQIENADAQYMQSGGGSGEVAAAPGYGN